MTTVLDSIADDLGSSLVSKDTWVTEIETWGDKIGLYRDYVDGVHRLEMTTEMAQMLRIDKEDDERFSINYADMVVNKMADRLHIERIEADNDAGTKWIKNLLDDSQFDELQIDVTASCIGDGDTFVIIDPPQEGKPMKFIHEPAWDNVSGVIPVYDNVSREIVAISKVWEDLSLDTDRINIYYEDKIEKFTNDGGLVATDDDNVIEWKDKSGQSLGIPFGHFRNRKKTRSTTGASEIQKILAPQDVLNRTFASMTMTAELTAFQRLAFIGMTADGNMSPGAIWEIVAKDKEGNAIAGIPKERQVDIKVIEPGEITQFVDQAQFTIEQISVISDTPIPSVMGGDVQSGEALKQREVGLVAKAKTSQIVMGNVWKSLIMKAHKIEETFGTKPPEIGTINVVWSEINVRDNKQLILNAVAVRDELDSETMLKEIEPAMAFSIADIPDIIEGRKNEQVNAIKQLPIPGFDRLS
jgi:hypothetical protein